MKKYLPVCLLLLSLLTMQTKAGEKYFFVRLSLQTDTSYENPVSVFLFAPGELPDTSLVSLAPAFTPDGKFVYLGQSSGSQMSIVISKKVHGNWTLPEIVPFSGKFNDLEPALSPDGKYLIFASSRPSSLNGAELEGKYNRQSYPRGGGNLWRVNISGNQSGAPERLPDIINSNSAVFTPSIAGDGSLYFMRAENGGGFHIYRSQMLKGKYQAPIRLTFGRDSIINDFDPVVSPDESILIFSSRRPPIAQVSDIFIVFRTGNSAWGPPIDLRYALSENVYGIETRFSPDYKTLYFTNSRNLPGKINKQARYIWKADISGLLKVHGIEQISNGKGLIGNRK